MKKYLSVIGAVLAIIGCFLPWVSVMGFSMNGFPGGMGGNPGALIVILAVLCGVFSFIGKKWSLITSIVLALLMVLWAGKQMMDASKFGEGVSVGIGIYLILIAGIIVIAGNVMGMKTDKAE